MGSIIHKPDGGKIIKTNCFECHAKCGALCHVDSKGRLVKVEGNPEDPRNEGRMCPKGRAAINILYHPDRLNYPMKRVGARGEGKWERITWDEAMDTIYTKIMEYRDQFGPESIVNAQGTGRGTNQWNQRLGNTIGVNHWLAPGHICLAPILVTSLSTIGMVTNWEGADLDRSEVQVFWGSNQIWTEQTYTSGGVNRGRDRNVKLIVIDPNFEHPLAARADHFIGLRPGSDSALAMAWIHVIIEENLYDESFCKRWTTAPILIDSETLNPITEDKLKATGKKDTLVVWDRNTQGVQPMDDHHLKPELDPELNGYFEIVDLNGEILKVKTAWQELRERAAKMTPEKAARLCWLEPKQIYDSARMYAKAKSAAISYFQGLEEHTNSMHTIHAVNTLMMITGNLDVFGGNMWPMFWNHMLSDRLTGRPTDPKAAEKKSNPFKLYVASHPQQVFETMLTGKPYPIKMYLGIAGNPLSWSEQPENTKKALLNLDFIVVMDYFLSPTAQLADIVLPSAHWTERDYIADEQCGRWYFAQQKAVDPLYERRSDVTFIRELGHKINPEMWPWQTDEELFDFQLEPEGVTYKELKDKWIHEHTPDVEKKYEANGFATPTKKAEIYSTVFQSIGIDPLADYEEPLESPYSEPEIAKDYPYILVTGRRYPNYYHSQYRGIPYLRELAPEPRVMINEGLAEELGIKEFDNVWIESPHGKCMMKAQLTNGLHPRVISIPHGWWQGCPELGLPDYPDFIANANNCITHKKHDKNTGSPGSRSSLCQIYKA
ncbi:MAG: molybdopterin-dependent oxidoreductase [Bacillota bacterium]|nr:molybdopterin-dependent oxidoreductase [Bacillota bacterium]